MHSYITYFDSFFRDYQIVGSEVHVDMFDDRIEIFSPGGMMSGRRVQDMDLRHIPSLRRNEIISDMFARLHFMDRRGSGIDRILRSYSEFDNKPEFYSEADYFLVTLPNRSVASKSQDVVTLNSEVIFSAKDVVTSSQDVVTSGLEVAFSAKDVVTSSQDVVCDKTNGQSKEHEVNAFCARIERITHWTKTTKEHTIVMFKKYRYEYTFNRRNIADVYGVRDSGATAILKKLKEANLVTSPQYGCYHFARG